MSRPKYKALYTELADLIVAAITTSEHHAWDTAKSVDYDPFWLIENFLLTRDHKRYMETLSKQPLVLGDEDKS